MHNEKVKITAACFYMQNAQWGAAKRDGFHAQPSSYLVNPLLHDFFFFLSLFRFF